MKSSTRAPKSVAFTLEPQIRTIAPTPRTRRRRIPLNMDKKLYEGFKSDEVTDEMLDEAAKLFSENYGVWGEHAAERTGKFAKAGRPVRLSKERLRNEYLPTEISSYVRVTVNGHLAGNAFACRWSVDGRTICWITQLVVHQDYRERGLATGLLDEIRLDGDDVYGVMSSHPAACLAASRAYKSPIDTASLEFMKDNAHSIMKISPVGYVRDAKLRGSLFDPEDSSGLVSSVDTGFFVDHEEPLEALAWVRESMDWPLGELLDGYENTAGPLGAIKSRAFMEVQNFSYQEICRLAFKHVMALSMDFHSNKDSAEIIKAVEQGNSINDLAELFLLKISPVVVDLVVAVCYVTSLFDEYVAFTTFIVGISYVCITIKLTNWTQLRRRIYKETSRTESNVVNESLRNWQTVLYFNQVESEKDRYSRAVQNSLDAKLAYRIRMNSGNAVETLIMFLGLLSASLLAIRAISSGEASTGDFVTLGTFWATMTYPLEMIAWSHSNMTSIFIDAERLLQLLRSGRTMFVVAHRLSTIMDADLILFIKDGDIVERGTHQELLGRKGEYFELWERQNGRQHVSTKR
ncbi:hypothetical protein E2P81_ATG07114 [Venturia nashicola]|nr:hypothetical protein E2P81_ATG07114 [Venturia nashicola]